MVPIVHFFQIVISVTPQTYHIVVKYSVSFRVGMTQETGVMIHGLKKRVYTGIEYLVDSEIVNRY